LSKNIRQGYKELAKHYKEGDEVFVFGFSRGAYSARSLVGLIRNCGILKQPDKKLIDEAYQIYRTRDEGADSDQARAFRRETAHAGEPTIKCLGVWDTVGALGVPVHSFDSFNKKFYQFHDTGLSGIVMNAFQALAIDEHRREYEATLWNSSRRPDQRVEQVWFPGAHSNVGGGYSGDKLADVTLRWMMDRANECGLALDEAKRPQLGAEHWTFELKDSFSEFLLGLYRFLNSRHYRPIGSTQNGCEKLDTASVSRYSRCAYQPKNEIGEYLGCESASAETVQSLVGGKIWHLLQKLGSTSDQD
jgi:hypothetical protein